MPTTGTPQTRLVVLRGNSGSGKSTTAEALRARIGRGCAWIEQDYLRRTVLKEHDVPGAPNIGLIDLCVRYALDAGFDVILDGILDAGRYGAMIEGLRQDHVGASHCYYFSVSFDETVRRHAGRPKSADFGAHEMRPWYFAADVLPLSPELTIAEDSSLDATVERILRDVGGG